MASTRTSLIFSARGPIPIQLDEQSPVPNCTSANPNATSQHGCSGASVLDLVFTQPESVSEIRFRNFYTARFTLLLRFDDSVQSVPKREHLAWAAAASLSLARLRGVNSTEGIKIGRNLSSSKSLSDWVVSWQNKVLMPDPHAEMGSQDYGLINASESLAPWHDITAMRFLLRQPSPNWKAFNLEDIMVFHYPVPNPCALNLGVLSPSASQLANVPDEEDEESELEILIRQTKLSLLEEALPNAEDTIDSGEGVSKVHSSYEIMTLTLGS